jgi:GAF domain-containing protein
VNSFGPGRWHGDFPWGDPLGTGLRVRSALENTEAALSRSAARLRAGGQEDRARRAERSAAWVRFDLDEPLAAHQLYTGTADLRDIRGLEPLASQVLEKVLSLARADYGNVQLADPASGALRIIAQYGFGAEFLDHFAVVADDRSACGRAASRGAQLVIPDVTTDPGFEPHREIAAASGFRAVQSTPLTDRAGRVIGVVSTHYPRPFAPLARDLRIISRYADLAGRVLASRLGAAAPAGPAAAGCEEQAALLAESLSQACLRTAAGGRDQERHLALAWLLDHYARCLGAWLGRPGAPERHPVLIDAVAAAIGMPSAGVILYGTQPDGAVAAASDATARAAHDLEFVLGEGPAHLAAARGQTVQVAGTALAGRWPQYGPAVARLGVRAVIAVPLRPAGLGAVCAYASQPAISEQAAMAVGRVADALPLALSQAMHDPLPDGVPALPLFGEADFPAVIHQAAGMVAQQCGCGISQALALLRARAFSAGRPAHEIAARVVRGELRLC